MASTPAQRAKIVVYARTLCIFCIRARWLLRSRGYAFDVVHVTTDDERRALAERTGRKTVPQIYIGERHVGGFDDLQALDRAGELARLCEA
jgi:glutaredoxin 3